MSESRKRLRRINKIPTFRMIPIPRTEKDMVPPGSVLSVSYTSGFPRAARDVPAYFRPAHRLVQSPYESGFLVLCNGIGEP